MPNLHGLAQNHPNTTSTRVYTLEEKVYIRELLDACFHDSLLPTGLCIEKAELGEDFARLDLDKDFADQQTEWLREHAVTIVFNEEAGNLSNKIKKQLVLVFENSWYDSGEVDLDTKRGRYQNEGKNLATYVASTSEIAEWLRQEHSVEIELNGKSYGVSFLPWMDLAEMKFYKTTGKPKIFWIRCVHVPLQLMAPLQIAVELIFGKVVKRHPFEEYEDEPELGTVRFDLEPMAELRVKSRLIVGIPRKGEYHVKVISAATPWCRKCRMNYHKETDNCCLAAEIGLFDTTVRDPLPTPPFLGFVPLGQDVPARGQNRFQNKRRRNEASGPNTATSISGNKKGNSSKGRLKGENKPDSKKSTTSTSQPSGEHKDVNPKADDAVKLCEKIPSSKSSENRDTKMYKGEGDESPVNKVNLDVEDTEDAAAF
ncbi:hypothetical protein CBR_g41527 [Chara braunii]|uniref:DUF4283 domain-containing protein n=1 Tax=Chara braunii TaxID=69332 RepID=A0A388K2Q3_CHABU|nr:hypothetical protein CBR_g41527 [Chara braunii]|eukprot:GBG64326.1 hypothetical protein CBR_g41527 [Chara braunii]